MVERREILRKTVGFATGAVAGCTSFGSLRDDVDPDVSAEQHLGAASKEVTHRAVENGRWDDPAVWAGQEVPGEAARALIQEDVSVTLRSDTARLDWLRIDGILTLSPSEITHLVAETVVSLPGSRLEVGTAQAPVRPDVEARITFSDTGPIDEERDPEREGRGLLAHGELTVRGAKKTAWTRLVSAPTAGEQQLELSEPPTNWQEGDRLVVPGVVPNEAQDEKRTIRSIDGTTISLDAAFGVDHVPPKESLDAYVLNLSRNVVFESESADTKRRGHTMIMSTKSDIRYAVFRDMGRTDKNRPITDPVRNADTVSDVEVNRSARYPLHYHHTGIGTDPHYAEGVAVDGSPGWGVVNHHSHADVVDSVAYDVDGAAFVAEGGNERGSFKRCISVYSSGSGEVIDSRSAGAHGGDTPIDDFGHAGHGFWLQSPLVEVIDCVAANHRHQAFVWWLRPLLDGDLAEGTSIEDSRVTYHPNLPWEYCNTDRPLFEAIEQGRFKNERVMRETKKIPSTFAEVAPITGNTAFASAGGADFSRHNFKWKHERFSDFDVISDMTVYNIGPFYHDDGSTAKPDLPRHMSSGHQGRGGSIGVSFRYTSNVSLKNSHIVGSSRSDSVGVPYHDYLWTLTIDDCTIENWDWGVGTGEHRITWIRNSVFRNNKYDVNWTLDNVGPAILDDNEFDRIRQQVIGNSKSSDVMEFGQKYGVRINGRTSYQAESKADYVPFPTEYGLNYVNNWSEVIDDATNLVGLTNQEMYDRYGIAYAGGRPAPTDIVESSIVSDGLLDPSDGRTPPRNVFIDCTDASSLGAWTTVDEVDASGDTAVEWTGSNAPTSDAASVTFECDAGTYEIYGRFRPDAWNGDDLFVRIDGGEWKTAEKLKTPIGFQWHDASPNDRAMHQWELSEGTHTIEFAAHNSGVQMDELFIANIKDAHVLGGYGAQSM